MKYNLQSMNDRLQLMKCNLRFMVDIGGRSSRIGVCAVRRCGFVGLENTLHRRSCGTLGACVLPCCEKREGFILPCSQFAVSLHFVGQKA